MRKLTFPTVDNTTPPVRRNAETGVEIRMTDGSDGGRRVPRYAVAMPVRSDFAIHTRTDSLSAARAAAVAAAESIRAARDADYGVAANEDCERYAAAHTAQFEQDRAWEARHGIAGKGDAAAEAAVAADIHEAYTQHLSNVWTKATMDLLNAGIVGDTPTREALDTTMMRYLADAHEDLELRVYDNVLTYAAAIENNVAAAIAAKLGRNVRIGNVTYSASPARPALRREVTVETTDTPAADRAVMSSDDVRITMGHDQAEKIVELMARHIDLDVVRLDNNDPDGAQLVINFIAALSNVLEN